jgi:hypothetical protein
MYDELVLVTVSSEEAPEQTCDGNACTNMAGGGVTVAKTETLGDWHPPLTDST